MFMIMFPLPTILRNKSVLFIRLLTFVCFFISIVASVNLILRSPQAFDSFLHFTAGRIIVEELRIPTHADISHKVTQSSLEWIDHSWLSDTILYLAGGRNETFGAIFLLAPLLFLSIYLSFLALREFEVTKKISLILISIAILLVLPYWRLLPIVFAVPILISLVYILSRREKIKKSKLLVYLSIIFFLWAQVWGGFIFIPLTVLGLFLIERGRLSRNFFTVIGIFAAAVGASLINPLGSRIYLYPLTIAWVIARQSQFSSLSGMLKLTNQSFIKQTAENLPQSIFLIYLMIVISVTLISIFRNFSKYRLIFIKLIPCLVLLLLPLFWLRFTPIAVFGSLPMAGLIISISIEKISEKWQKRGQIIMVIAVLALGLRLLIEPPFYFRPDLPRQQVELIEKWKLPANILTSYDLTGFALYKLYPKRLLIDAQDDLFDENALLAFISPSNPVPMDAFSRIMTENKINTLLVTGDIGELAVLAASNPDWALLYFESNGYIFVNKESVSAEFLAENQLMTVDFTRNLGFDPNNSASVAAELVSFIKRYPDNILARGQLATVYRIQKQFQKAEKLLYTIPFEKWDFTLKTEMGRLTAAQGKCFAAEKWLLSALKERKERNFARATLDLAVVYAGCIGDKEKAKHYFERFNSYALDPGERELQRQVAEEYGIPVDEQ